MILGIDFSQILSVAGWSFLIGFILGGFIGWNLH